MCHEVRSTVLAGPSQDRNACTDDLLRQERGWKFFMFLPRMLLYRPPRGVSCWGKLLKRFDQFNRGAWTSLVEASRTCCQQAAVVRRRRSRRGEKDLGRLVHMGELSSTRQGRCLTGSRFGRHSPGVLPSAHRSLEPHFLDIWPIQNLTPSTFGPSRT